jgi:hypothetical protein
MEQKPLNTPRFWIRGLLPGVLIGIGLVHSFVGFSSGRELLVEIAREGFWDTIRTGSEPISRPLLLWFLVAGFFLLMLGHLALWVERRAKQPLPSSFGIELLVFAVVLGVVNGGALPAWLFAAGAVYILLIAKAARRANREK